MTLTLTIRNVDRLDNGMPAEFVLNRRGAMIGRAATCDWSLPDPRNFISSRHGEVTFRDGFYYFKDISTNGTFLNGGDDRMDDVRRVEQGDMFLIGHYEVVAALSGSALAALEQHDEAAQQEAERQAGWSWDTGGEAPAAAAPGRGGGGGGGGWGDAPANAGLSSGAGGLSAPLDGGWGGAAAAGGGDWGAAPASSSNGGWGAAPAAAPDSDWSGAPAASNEGWGAAPEAPGGGGGWAAPSAPAAPDAASWAPQSGPSLSAPTPYASRSSAAPPPPSSGPMDSSNSWAPARQQEEERAPSPWDQAQAPVQQSSAWSSAVSDRPKVASPDDIWGSMESSNVVDWARADFGQKAKVSADPLGLNKPPPSAALPKETPRAPVAAPPPADDRGGWCTPEPATASAGGWAAPEPSAPAADAGWATVEPVAPAAPPIAAPTRAAPPPAPPPARVAPPAPAPAAAPAAPDMAQIAIAFAVAAGLKPEQVKQPSADTLERAGELVRRLVSGLVVMVEARARAKSQMGAEQTGLEFDGNNPIKFARTPEQALAQLLNPPERGFMPAEKAIEDAYFDLQSHQMATLKAMQGALRATLDRFSPAAIKKRAESGGFLSRLLPGGREATLWQTYEREFSGVAQGSDEAFMDVFAKEFRQAYDEQSRNRKR